jgi:hypothetical protein
VQEWERKVEGDERIWPGVEVDGCEVAPPQCATAGSIYKKVFDHNDQAKARGLNSVQRMLYPKHHSGPLMEERKQMCAEKIKSKLATVYSTAVTLADQQRVRVGAPSMGANWPLSWRHLRLYARWGCRSSRSVLGSRKWVGLGARAPKRCPRRSPRTSSGSIPSCGRANCTPSKRQGPVR